MLLMARIDLRLDAAKKNTIRVGTSTVTLCNGSFMLLLRKATLQVKICDPYREWCVG